MRTPLAISAVLAGALLLTACGTEVSGSRPGGNTAPGACGAGAPGGSADLATEGVEITAPAGGLLDCGPATASDTFPLRFQVANHEAEALTYTIRFELVSASGEALTYPKAIVAGVGPGRTVRSSTTLGDPMSRERGGVRVRIDQVRSVPADEAPVVSGPCPPSGVRVTADQGDAAMGLRVVGLHLENCSDHAYRVNGFPQVQLLDQRHEPVTGVTVLHGSGGISTSAGFDVPPRPLTLRPGESATSGLMWRNTVQSGSSVNVPYVRVTAKGGAQPVMITPELDLGTTGKLAVGPWQKSKPSP
ncbi:DUF4232 domain-containing protein [Streptomyces sp. NBC_01477]|uniref:DUF4232 domain-containing protein n=1 Tax=Streptomyces sp. NBC_01477 TaxID=2976015 RepID=UPI002E318AB4|nr:DUF4232 domain-containing protein [Streptomyces sp. NBC_01477]